MSELYLVAHKVRGEPAFDIAERIEIAGEPAWIIPTSGHRAYPSDYIELNRLQTNMGEAAIEHLKMPDEGLRDHYETTRESPQRSASSKLKIVDIDLDELDLWKGVELP